MSRPQKHCRRTCHSLLLRRYLISQHADVEARLAAELDAVGLLVTHERPQPRALQHEDVSRLTYLSCVCKVYCLILYYKICIRAKLLSDHHGTMS